MKEMEKEIATLRQKVKAAEQNSGHTSIKEEPSGSLRTPRVPCKKALSKDSMTCSGTKVTKMEEPSSYYMLDTHMHTLMYCCFYVVYVLRTPVIATYVFIFCVCLHIQTMEEMSLQK